MAGGKTKAPGVAGGADDAQLRAKKLIEKNIASLPQSRLMALPSDDCRMLHRWPGRAEELGATEDFTCPQCGGMRRSRVVSTQRLPSSYQTCENCGWTGVVNIKSLGFSNEKFDGTKSLGRFSMSGAHGATRQDGPDIVFNDPEKLRHTQSEAYLQLARDIETRRRSPLSIDAVIKVLVRAMDHTRKPDLFWLPALPSKHRHEASWELTDDKLKWKVLKVLSKFPIGSLYDLFKTSVEEWAEIGAELGGLTLRHVKTKALEYVQQDMQPVDRAAFWAAVGVRQHPKEHKKSLQFPQGYR